MFPALVGLLGGGSAIGGAVSGLLGGGGAGGLIKGLLSGGGGGLLGMISKLFGGAGGPTASGGPSGQGSQDALALLGDIKNMLGQVIDSLGQQQGGTSHGCGAGREPHANGGGHNHGSNGAGQDHDGGHSCGSSHGKPEGCGGSDEASESGWDGEDKSPSLDREMGAKRLLELAKNTNDPEQKRELIKMALEMLNEGGCSCDGNSYDKDMVEQAEKMLESLDDSNLNGCNARKVMDSIIDMLMEEGGVDGKPAGNDENGDGWRDSDSHRGGGLWHLHDHQTMHR